jgi:hypothetical protein
MPSSCTSKLGRLAVSEPKETNYIGAARSIGRALQPSAALGAAMSESQRAFERALHESSAIADLIREAIADAPPKLVILALCVGHA